MILVDTNILLDIVTEDPNWKEWSEQQLENAKLIGSVIINPVIYSELSIAFARIEEVEAFISDAPLIVEPIPREALFMAAKSFLKYRRRDGKKHGILPDFYIGAHAAVEKCPILTRDVKRFRTNFPTVELITPP